MKKRCDNCKHWEAHRHFDRAAAAYGDDDADTELDVGICTRISEYDAKARIFVSPTSGSFGQTIRFDTHRSFGCVLWERGS